MLLAGFTLQGRCPARALTLLCGEMRVLLKKVTSTKNSAVGGGICRLCRRDPELHTLVYLLLITHIYSTAYNMPRLTRTKERNEWQRCKQESCVPAPAEQKVYLISVVDNDEIVDPVRVVFHLHRILFLLKHSTSTQIRAGHFTYCL